MSVFASATLNTFHLNSAFVGALTERSIRAIVIGGLAVKHYCPEREADDLDLLVEPTETAGAVILDVLYRFNDIPGFDPKTFARPKQHYQQKRALYLDVLTPHAEDNFDQLWERTTSATLNGLPVQVAGLSDLLAMKRRAVLERGDAKDRRDVELLESVAV